MSILTFIGYPTRCHLCEGHIPNWEATYPREKSVYQYYERSLATKVSDSPQLQFENQVGPIHSKQYDRGIPRPVPDKLLQNIVHAITTSRMVAVAILFQSRNPAQSRRGNKNKPTYTSAQKHCYRQPRSLFSEQPPSRSQQQPHTTPHIPPLAPQ